MYIHEALHQRVNTYLAITLLLSVTMGASLMIWNVSKAVGEDSHPPLLSIDLD